MALLDETLALFNDLEDRQAMLLEAALVSGMDEMLGKQIRPNASVEMSAAARGRISLVLSRLWSDTVRESVGQVEAELAALSAKAEPALTNRILTDYIGRHGGYRAAQIILTTEHQIRDMMLGGMAAGEAQAAVFANISERIPELAKTRALLITRTETHTANQFASQQFAEASALALTKTWHSVIDDRTRRFGLLGRQDAFNHLVMNGVTAPLREAFAVPTRAGGFESLLFPGHPGGSAGNTINCRCVQTYERDT